MNDVSSTQTITAAPSVPQPSRVALAWLILPLAVLALAVGAVSLPAIYDRKLSAGHAVGLSIRTVAAHPRLFLTWGIVVAVGLALGSLPAFLGLLVVLPVFGHATWHLYRATAADPVRPPAF